MPFLVKSVATLRIGHWIVNSSLWFNQIRRIARLLCGLLSGYDSETRTRGPALKAATAQAKWLRKVRQQKEQHRRQRQDERDVRPWEHRGAARQASRIKEAERTLAVSTVSFHILDTSRIWCPDIVIVPSGSIQKFVPLMIANDAWSKT